MKRVSIFLTAVCVLSIGYSQNMYITLSGGYHLSAPSGNLTSSSIPYAGTSTSSNGTTTSLFGTLGKGAPVNLAVGRMFNENLGIELGFNYLFGSAVTLGEDNYTDFATLDVDIHKATARTSQFRLTPQVIAKTGGLYAKVGLIIPVVGKTTLTTSSQYLAGSISSVETELEIKGHPTVGFMGSIGYQYELSEKIALFGEFQAIALTLKSNTAEFTKFEINGNDELANIETYGRTKKTEYVDDLSLEDANNPLSGKAQSFKRNYSSFGFNLGLKYLF